MFMSAWHCFASYSCSSYMSVVCVFFTLLCKHINNYWKPESNPMYVLTHLANKASNVILQIGVFCSSLTKNIQIIHLVLSLLDK